MKAIVTVKFNNIVPNYDKYGKIQKVCGPCPLSLELNKSIFCSDVYGKHHSYIEEGKSLDEIERKAKQKFGHVTRVEDI